MSTLSQKGIWVKISIAEQLSLDKQKVSSCVSKLEQLTNIRAVMSK